MARVVMQRSHERPSLGRRAPQGRTKLETLRYVKWYIIEIIHRSNTGIAHVRGASFLIRSTNAVSIRLKRVLCRTT